jgi:hypothetical protein
MHVVKLVFTCFLVFFLILLTINPVFATQYTVGVNEEDYVKFGRSNVNSGVIAYLLSTKDIMWWKVEISGVSGTEVRCKYSMQFVDSTFEDQLVINVATGQVQPANFGAGMIIIGSNLNQGDLVFWRGNNYTINKSETRTYLGTSRSVNIIENDNISFIFDKTTGIILEIDGTFSNEYTPRSESIIETNIFRNSTPFSTQSPTTVPTTNPSPTVPEFPLSILIITFLITATLVGTIVIKKKQSTRR